MLPGSVTVTAAGTVTKSGLAEAIYDARVASLATIKPPAIIPSGPAGYAIKNGLAADANALSSAMTATLASSVPTGSIVMWFTATPPTGWLVCNFAEVSRATYADLFAVIGTSAGVGNGTTTFNLPDLRGRMPLGVGTGTASDATAHTLNQKSGTETVTLISAQMPSHTHAIADHSHEALESGGKFVVGDAGGTVDNPFASGSDYREDSTTAVASLTPANTGGGDAHGNMPPYIGLHFIIKT